MSRRSALLPVLASIVLVGVLLPGAALGLSSENEVVPDPPRATKVVGMGWEGQISVVVGR